VHCLLSAPGFTSGVDRGGAGASTPLLSDPRRSNASRPCLHKCASYATIPDPGARADLRIAPILRPIALDARARPAIPVQEAPFKAMPVQTGLALASRCHRVTPGVIPADVLSVFVGRGSPVAVLPGPLLAGFALNLDQDLTEVELALQLRSMVQVELAEAIAHNRRDFEKRNAAIAREVAKLHRQLRANRAHCVAMWKELNGVTNKFARATSTLARIRPPRARVHGGREPRVRIPRRGAGPEP
jgi:hypothetical protein